VAICLTNNILPDQQQKQLLLCWSSIWGGQAQLCTTIVHHRHCLLSSLLLWPLGGWGSNATPHDNLLVVIRDRTDVAGLAETCLKVQQLYEQQGLLLLPVCLTLHAACNSSNALAAQPSDQAGNASPPRHPTRCTARL